MRESGRLVWWVDARGFGFATLIGRETDVFVHLSDLRRGLGRQPAVGERLTCAVEEAPRGLRARDVVLEGDES